MDNNYTCNCRHNSNSRDNEPCCRCDSKHTNADRIRNMSDEELAELFAQYSCEDADYTSLLPIKECKWGDKKEVINRNLKWLQSKAE